jgi:hypothetical protein
MRWPLLIAATLCAATSWGCRGRREPEAGPTPRSEWRAESPPDAAEATEATVATDVHDAEDRVDPCEHRGPSPGETCGVPGLVCLAIRNTGLVEIRCEDAVWKQAPAAPSPRAPAGKCPIVQPVSGSPCAGASACRFGSCSATDPASGTPLRTAWVEVWTCYRGEWRRYDEYCLGE